MYEKRQYFLELEDKLKQTQIMGRQMCECVCVCVCISNIYFSIFYIFYNVSDLTQNHLEASNSTSRVLMN